MGTAEVGSVATAVRRVSIVACVAVALGCTLTPGHGMGGAFAEDGGGETGSADDPAADASSGSPEQDEDTSGGSDDGGGTTAGTFDPLDGSSSTGGDGGSSGEASTGAPADTGADDPGGAYAACDTNDDCGDDPGLACLHADENGAGGFCSPSCGTYGATPPDASLCPDTPAGVTATVVCVEGFVRSCALACQDDADCPTGTGCLAANGGGGPFCFGL